MRSSNVVPSVGAAVAAGVSQTPALQQSVAGGAFGNGAQLDDVQQLSTRLSTDGGCAEERFFVAFISIML